MFTVWRDETKKDPAKEIIDYLVDLPDPRNSIVLELIKYNPHPSMYSEAQAKIREKELQQQEELRRNIKVGIAGAFVGVIVVAAAAAAIFFTGGTILALAPLLFLVGSAIAAGLLGGGLAVGAKKTWNAIKEKFSKQQSQVSPAVLPQENVAVSAKVNAEVSAVAPDDGLVADEQVMAVAAPEAILREHVVPTLEVAVISGVIEKLAQKSSNIVRPVTEIESVSDDEDSGLGSISGLTEDCSDSSSLNGSEKEYKESLAFGRQSMDEVVFFKEKPARAFSAGLGQSASA